MSSTAGTGISIEIVVQPPNKAGVGRTLQPPIIARTNDAQVIEDYQSNTRDFFGYITPAWAADGNFYPNEIDGATSVSPQLLEQNRSSSHSTKWLYFIFNHVRMKLEGDWYLCVGVNDKVGMGSQNIGMVSTRLVKIESRAPNAEHPSTSVSSKEFVIHC